MILNFKILQKKFYNKNTAFIVASQGLNLRENLFFSSFFTVSRLPEIVHYLLIDLLFTFISFLHTGVLFSFLLLPLNQGNVGRPRSHWISGLWVSIDAAVIETWFNFLHVFNGHLKRDHHWKWQPSLTVKWKG